MAQGITLKADGTFEAAVLVAGPGRTKEFADTGTRSAPEKQITLVGKDSGTATRNYRWVGNNVEVDLTELGITMQYGKVK